MTGLFPPIEPSHGYDEHRMVRAAESRIVQLRRRRRILTGAVAATVGTAALIIPLALTGDSGRPGSVQVVGEPTSTVGAPITTTTPPTTSTVDSTTIPTTAPRSSPTPPIPIWTTSNLPPGVGMLNDISCPGPSHCYAVGGQEFGSGSGWIIVSTDGGQRWSILYQSPQSGFASIACPDVNTCVAVGGRNASGGQSPEAVVTTDGGQSWTSRTLPSRLSDLPLDVSCPSPVVCVAVSSTGIDRTTDAGTTWTLAELPSGMAEADSVTCQGGMLCLIGGSGPGPEAASPAMASASHDMGATWSPVVIAGGPSGLGPISCTDPDDCVGLVLSGAANSYGFGTPTVTTDGGTTWKEETSAIGQAVSCRPSFCLSVGAVDQGPPTDIYSADAFTSSDGGLHWTTTNVYAPDSLSAVTCLSATDCVAVGGNSPDGTAALAMTYHGTAPSTGLPVLRAGGNGLQTYAAIEPRQINFSGDSGDIVTDLSWASWTTSSAVGYGTSDHDSCNPDCAEAPIDMENTALTLSQPRNGQFTVITEQRGGVTETFTDPGQWPLSEGTPAP